MNKLVETSKLINNDDEYDLIIENTTIEEHIKSILNKFHISDVENYIIANNDELINSIILRIIAEIFIHKIKLKNNKPYIVNTKINDTLYRMSITKLVKNNESKYIYGLIIK